MEIEIQKIMLSSANRVNDDVDNEGTFVDISSESENVKCQCSSRTSRIAGISRNRSFIIYIYTWITVFSICCQGLPPVIKIGMLIF